MSIIVMAMFNVTVILTVALVAVRCATRARAAIRHVVLAVAFGGLLVLPVAMLALPKVAVRLAVVPASVAETILPALSIDPLAVQSLPTRSIGAGPTSAEWSVSIENILLTLWATGVALVLLPVVLSTFQLRRIPRQSTSFGRGQTLLNELTSDLGMTRAIGVAIHADIAGPMTYGVRRPVIVFPPDAGEWTDADVRRALRHELEHVRRADCLIDLITRVTCAVYWFHPLVWTSWRRLRLEAERACDDAVLQASDAIGYADQLVTLAERITVRHAPRLLAMASHHDLSLRVTAVLDRGQRRGRAGRASVAGLVAVGVTVVAAIAPLRASWQTAAVNAPAFDVVSVKENTSGDPFGGGDRQETRLFPGGRLVARNTTLRELILLAYRWEITRTQLSGVTQWMDQRRFDIEARAAEGVIAPGDLDVPRAQLMDRMLQSLLADRFQLRVTREQRIGDLHVLAIAPGGPKLTLAKDPPCAAGKNPGGLTVRADLDSGRACHWFKRIGRTGFEAVAIDSTDIAMGLRNYLGRPVVDRARLTSLYNVTVRWRPDGPSRANGPGAFTEPQADENDPDIYTALREQLGLKLTIERAPIEMLIVQSAEPPTAN